MIAITKTEKEEISRLFPNVHIVRTMKQKSKRHRYYCEETRQVMNWLRKNRCGFAEQNDDKREGAYNRNRKKTGRKYGRTS